MMSTRALIQILPMMEVEVRVEEEATIPILLIHRE